MYGDFPFSLYALLPPPARCTPFGPDITGIAPRQEAWEWVYRRVRAGIDVSNWQHRAHFDELRDFIVGVRIASVYPS